MATEAQSEALPRHTLQLLRIHAGWRRQRLLVVACLGLVAAAVVLAAPEFPVSYESVAVIDLRPDVAAVTRGSAGLDPTPPTERSVEEARERSARQLVSTDTLNLTAAALIAEGLLSEDELDVRAPDQTGVLVIASDSGKRRLAHAVLWLQKALKVERIPRSPLASLSLRHQDPAQAQRVLELHCRLFQERAQGSADVGPLLHAAREQHGTAVTALNTARQRLQEFDAQHGWDGEDCVRLLSERIDRLADQLAIRQASAEGAAARVRSLESGVAAVPAQFAAEPWRIANPRHACLLQLLTEARERVLKSPFRDGSEEMLILNEPVTALQAELQSEEPVLEWSNPDLANPAHYQLMADLMKARAESVSALAEVGVLRADSSAAIGRAAALRATIPERSALVGAHEAARLAENAKMAVLLRIQGVHDMQKGAQLGELPFVESPTLPLKPVRFGRTAQLLMLLTTCASLVLFAFVIRWLCDGVVRGAADVHLATGSPPVLVLLAAVRGNRAAASGMTTDDLSLEALLLGLKSAGVSGPNILVCSVAGAEASAAIAEKVAARLAKSGSGAPVEQAAVGVAEALALGGGSAATATLVGEVQAARSLIVDAGDLSAGLPPHELLTRADAILVVAACGMTRRETLAAASDTLGATRHPRIGIVLVRGKVLAAARAA